MANLRAGIEVPIIPEDFIGSGEEMNLDLMELYMQWVYRCLQDGQDPADWMPAETIPS
jgi:hypothetical protein